MSDVVIGSGNLAGRGVYATRDFERGEVVISYHLKTLTKSEFLHLPESEKEFTHRHRGAIHLYSEPERYVNHSSDPNTEQDFTRWCDIAKRNIKKGEPITTNAVKDELL